MWRPIAKGGFEVLLPASGDIAYNLVAHDGKFRQWRTWANGVLPPFRAKPGEELRDVELRLARPAAVSDGCWTMPDTRSPAARSCASATTSRRTGTTIPPPGLGLTAALSFGSFAPASSTFKSSRFYLNATQASGERAERWRAPAR